MKILVFKEGYSGHEEMYDLLRAAKVAHWRLK
jgi:hypothetical protein